MRNIIKFALSAVLVVAPTFAFAATDTEIRASIVQQLLSTFVVQVNALDKINGLVAQASDQAQFDIFKALIAQQLSETTGQLATLLNPSQQSQLPTYGGVSNTGNNTPMNTEPVDQSAIVVTQKTGEKIDTVNGLPYGSVVFEVYVLDSNGKHSKDAVVHANYPADANYPHSSTLTPEQDNATNPNINKGMGSISGIGATDYHTNFEYVPTTKGQKTIIFTSGSLSKEVSVTI